MRTCISKKSVCIHTSIIRIRIHIHFCRSEYKFKYQKYQFRCNYIQIRIRILPSHFSTTLMGHNLCLPPKPNILDIYT